MGTGTDATYAGQLNYQEQGAARNVIGGELDVVSGGAINIEDGGSITLPVQTLGTSQVATDVTNYGLTTVAATSTGPTYTLAAPVAGVSKIIACTANTTASGTALINTNSTGVSLTSSGDNVMTMNSIKDRVILVAASTTSWIIASMMGSTDAGITTGTQST